MVIFCFQHTEHSFIHTDHSFIKSHCLSNAAEHVHRFIEAFEHPDDETNRIVSVCCVCVSLTSSQGFC